MTTLSGKSALITGGARGQGRSHAVALAKAGVNIGLVDLGGKPPLGSAVSLGTADDLARTKGEIEALGVGCLSAEADVRDGAALSAFADELAAEFGSVDYALANAGIFSWGEVAEMSDDTWQEMLDVNLGGIFKTFRAVAPHFKRQNSGRAIATASMAGRGGFAMIGHYVAAKWGLIGLTKSFALELVPHGATANVVAPTNCETDMIDNERAYAFFAGKEGATKADAAEACKTMVPQGIPWIQPQDVTNAVLFLLSDEAQHVTGEVLHVSGGMSATNAV